ncbi:MAG: hypothetical protein KGI41_00065 [Patescibacteria group bacterium]|nr:hypothetical protein [Patescibacteria group bacterium]MDE1965631.1 hypothetical protein [Patescibacteria group bacterium]
MRPRIPALAILASASALLLAPSLALAQPATTIDSNFHIVPTDACPLGINAVIGTINNLTHFAVVAGIIVAVLVMAYAAILWILTPFSPKNREEGRTMLISAVIGLFFVLTAWLIVSAFLAVFLAGGSFASNWQTILQGTGSGNCLPVPAPPAATSGAGASATPGTTPGGSQTAGPLCQTSACSPSALQSIGFNQNQANAMSCIAMTESSGQPAICNGNACGIFQIMLTANKLTGSACAKYNNGNSTLDCPALCKAANGGAVNNEPSCQPCAKAARDAQCNDQSAYAMFQTSKYGPWTTSSDNTKSGACVAKYDPQS